MGNCLQKPVTWVDDDDWETAEERSDRYPQSGKTKTASKTTKGDSDGGATTTDQVKIKISKKQLEKVLQQAGDGKGMQLEQVLMDLVNLGHVVYRAQEEGGANRRWRPKLPSIPEIAE